MTTPHRAGDEIAGKVADRVSEILGWPMETVEVALAAIVFDLRNDVRAAVLAERERNARIAEESAEAILESEKRIRIRADPYRIAVDIAAAIRQEPETSP